MIWQNKYLDESRNERMNRLKLSNGYAKAKYTFKTSIYIYTVMYIHITVIQSCSEIIKQLCKSNHSVRNEI